MELGELVLKARDGDEAAFGELVARFSPAVRALCLMRSPDPATADDLAQQVFLTAWQRLPTLQDAEQFWSWLKAIARNHLLNEWRRVKREQSFRNRYTVAWLAANAPEREGAHESPEELAIQLASLRDCVADLPENLQRLVKLTYVEKCTSQEIGRRENRSAEAVRQALVRLRDRLKLCIERKLAAKGLSG